MPITLSHSIKSLGFVIDENLKFNSHVSAVCKSCYFHIRVLRHLRPMMSTKRATMVACAIVSSRLDYCNSVLAGMSDANFKKLERVQYSLARVVIGMHVYSRDHMMPVLAKLHWLPRPGLFQDRHDGIQGPTDGAAILPCGTHRRCCSIKDTTVFSKSTMHSERI